MANERGKAWSERWFAPFELVNVFNNGRPNSLYSLGPWWTFVFGGLIFSVPAVTGLARAVAYRDEEERSSRRDSAVFLLLLSALPLVIAGDRTGHSLLRVPLPKLLRGALLC